MADQWYVGRSGQKAGPYTTEQLRQLAAAGQLVASDLLWKEGLANWVPISQVKGLLPADAGGTLPSLDQPAPAGGGDFAFLDPAPAAQRGGAEWNPYQAGAGTLAAGTAAGGPFVYADFPSRIAAFFIDSIIVTIGSMLLQFGLGFVVVAAGGEEALVAIAAWIGSVLAFVLTIFYFVGYETSAKQGTWGKQLLGIRVTDLDGRRITTGRAVGRFFAKILSNLTCFIGYFLPLFTDRKQTLHDLICGCLALKK